MRLPEGSETLGASLNRRWRSVPRRPEIRTTADRHAVARATWRRRALGDEAVDEHALLTGAGGEWEWLGRHRHGQRLSGGGGG